MKRIAVSILLACSVSATHAVEADADAARAFFDRYRELGNRYDAAIADLYAEDATIELEERRPDGNGETVEIPAGKWKKVIPKALDYAKSEGHRTEFSNVEVSVDGDVARIEADRYPSAKCFTDTGYYMVVEKQADGEYKIVREHIEGQKKSEC